MTTKMTTLDPYHQKILVESVGEALYSFPHLVEYPSAMPVTVTAESPGVAIQQVLEMLADGRARWA